MPILSFLCPVRTSLFLIGHVAVDARRSAHGTATRRLRAVCQRRARCVGSVSIFALHGAFLASRLAVLIARQDVGLRVRQGAAVGEVRTRSAIRTTSSGRPGFPDTFRRWGLGVGQRGVAVRRAADGVVVSQWIGGGGRRLSRGSGRGGRCTTGHHGMIVE
jgi:hypothetical protein